MTSLALRRPLRGLAALLAAAALSLSACGGGSDGDAAPAALAATFTPPSGALGTTQTIRVTFNASMNVTSQVLAGTLGDANMLAGWITTVVPNDTLVLTPALPWATGAQTVTVQATDAAGRTLAAPAQASYAVAAAAACGPSAGACNNASDCGFTVSQLATSTQACFIANGLDADLTSTCVEQDGVSAACADCTTAMAGCGVLQCFSPCAGGFDAPACAACVATNCGAAFVACAGRTL
jgi:hypothetical protein